MTDLRTDPELLALLAKAATHVMSADERFEQRVSFIYGMQDFDAPGLSKEAVREWLRAYD